MAGVFHSALYISSTDGYDPGYPVDARTVPSVTAITNASDLAAVNAARRQVLKTLAKK